MALLPPKEAASLSSFMKGGAPADDSEPDTEGGSELDSCINDVADAVSSGDKAGIVSALHALVDTLKSEDASQDAE